MRKGGPSCDSLGGVGAVHWVPGTNSDQLGELSWLFPLPALSGPSPPQIFFLILFFGFFVHLFGGGGR